MDDKKKVEKQQESSLEKVKDKKANEELFKKALVEGVNNHFQKIIDSYKE